jgi:uncharacterized protein (TIGR03435 family)
LGANQRFTPNRVTGSNLKKRIEAIMTNRSVLKLNFTRKVAVIAVGAVALAVPVAVGIMNTPFARAQSFATTALGTPETEEDASAMPVNTEVQSTSPAAPDQATITARPEFEVASVKPSVMSTGGGAGGRIGGGCMEALRIDRSRVEFACTFVGDMISYAFRVPNERVIAQGWVKDRAGTRLDIEAKLAQGASTNQVPEMFQALLADRFKLVIHRASAELAVFALVVAKGGLKLKEAAPETPADPDAAPSNVSVLGGVETRSMRERNPNGGFTTTMINPRIGAVKVTDGSDGTHRWDAPSTTLEGLADLLGRFAPGLTNVMDMTGVSGRYQVVLDVSTKDMLASMPAPASDTGARENGEMDMASAALKAMNGGLAKLGLQLERRKGPVETVVVDHVEKTPTGN